MAQNGPSQRLAREAIGLREVLFQSITHMAPAAAVAFSIIVGANFAAGALPLSVVLALVGCLLVAVSIGQLARRLPSAGGFATYAARGLHPAVGFLVGWGYAFVEPLVAPLLFLIFGNVVASTLNQEFGWSYDTWWVVSAVVAAVVVFVLGWFGVRLSTGAGTILGLFEILVFAALAVTLIFQAGDANTLAVFGTGFADVEGFAGLSGVIAGSVYTILAFIGFEAAAPLAEEAKDPRRTIRLAVLYSCLGIGLFYVLTTYAATVAFGPERFAEFPSRGTATPGTPWPAGPGGPAGCWCSWPSPTRPSPTPTPRPTPPPGPGSPSGGSASCPAPGARQPALAVPGRRRGRPVRGRGRRGRVAGAAVRPADRLRPGRHHRHRRHHRHLHGGEPRLPGLLPAGEGRAEFNPLLHGLVPILGIAAFLPAFLTAVGIQAFDFISALPYPISLVGPVVGIWYAIGLVYLVVLATRRPERLRETGRVFMEEPAGEAVPADAKECHGRAHLPAGPGGVRLDLRRRAAGPPGPAGQHPGAVDRGRLRGRVRGPTTSSRGWSSSPSSTPRPGRSTSRGPSPGTPWPSTSCRSSRRGTGPPRRPSRCSGR